MVQGMQMIGQHLGVDHIYIWENFKKTDDKFNSRLLYKWSNMESAGKDKQLSDLMPEWEDQLHKNEHISASISDLNEKEKPYLSEHGIKSILAIPIFLKGGFWGFVSFDDCHKERVFPEWEINILQSWCLLVVGTMQRVNIALNMEAVTKNYKGLIWSIDNDGIIRTFKGRYTQYLEPFSSNVEGTKFDTVTHSVLHTDMIKYVKRTIVSGPQNWISEVHKKVFSSSTVPMYDENGRIIGVVGSTDEVTETVNLQRELEEASRSKTNFLAKMSHEIRTPMNAIIGMTELAMREDIPATAQEHIITIKQAGTNLLSIINDILDFSKIETGKLEIKPADYLLSSLLNEVVNIIKMKVLECRLRFIVNIDSNMSNQLFGDAVRIRQILLNLLSNAVKYTEKGYISLSITGENTGNGSIRLVIKVTDSGRGIKQEDIKKLFTEFTRLDTSSNAGVEGTGLGLVITQNLARAMDGDINVQSVYGEGSTFTVTLPQKIQGEKRVAVVEDPDEKKVLIFERREICINSIINTMKSLSVTHRLVSTESEFYQELMSRKYTHVLLASVLYDRVKKRYVQFKSEAKFMLIAEFGETILEHDVKILTTPIYSIPVANFLNGIFDGITFSTHHESIARFTAPAAKVLVVDDINTNLKVTEGLLQPYGMHVDVCKSGMAAIEMIKNEYYDIVFMDHMMPEMDGIEATARIRVMGETDSYYKTMPIIALTANAVSGTKEMFHENGLDDYLPKPIDTINLNQILEKWIPKTKQIIQTEMMRPVDEEIDTEAGRNLAIKGLNIRKGLATTGGAIKDYINTLGIFYKDGIEKIKEIGLSFESEDIQSYVIYTHALKSAAASIGAEKLSSSAAALEDAGKKKDLAFMTANTNLFIAELEELLRNIHGFLVKETNESPQSMDRELLFKTLIGLKEAFEALDSAEINKMADILQDFTIFPEVGESITNILQNRLIGEYDDSVKIIEDLLQTLYKQ